MHKLPPEEVTSEYHLIYEAALEARKRAYAPYSNFLVGAPLIDEFGNMHTGCNVENASYGLTICAERVAIFKMVATGATNIAILCCVTKDGSACCGACRQVIWEFCGGRKNIPILLGDTQGNINITTNEELLPHGFELV